MVIDNFHILNDIDELDLFDEIRILKNLGVDDFDVRKRHGFSFQRGNPFRATACADCHAWRGLHVGVKLKDHVPDGHFSTVNQLRHLFNTLTIHAHAVHAAEVANVVVRINLHEHTMHA